MHLKRTAGVLMIQKAQTMHDGPMHYCPVCIPDFEERKHMYGYGHRCRTDDGRGTIGLGRGEGGDGREGLQRSLTAMMFAPRMQRVRNQNQESRKRKCH